VYVKVTAERTEAIRKVHGNMAFTKKSAIFQYDAEFTGYIYFETFSCRLRIL